jgi:hypothetical protein
MDIETIKHLLVSGIVVAAFIFAFSLISAAFVGRE